MRIKINKAMENKEPTCLDNLTMPLIFDLIGPFLVHLGKHQVSIYAPLCEDHHANLLTDAQDFSLCGFVLPPPTNPCAKKPSAKGVQKVYNYRLTGPVAAAGAQCDRERARELLRVVCKDFSEAVGEYHLKMTVPVPNKIASLRAETVWIHKNTSTMWLSKGCKDNPPPKRESTGGHDPEQIVNSRRARGLRFIYNECEGQPKVKLKAGTPPVGLDELCAVTRGLVFGGPVEPHYSMTLRYAALHSASASADPDDAYADAYSCFEHLRNLVPRLPDWRVDFNNPIQGTQSDYSTGPNPHDCLSPNLILQNADDPD